MTRYSTLYSVSLLVLLEHATNDTLLYTVQSLTLGTARACYVMTRYSTLYRVMALLLELPTNDTLLYTGTE